jgi:hypothetical protein
MDAKLWMDEPPPEPTQSDLYWAGEMRRELQTWLKLGNDRNSFPFERTAFRLTIQSDNTSPSDVSWHCRKVKAWVEFQRRREAKRMSEGELAAFRRALDWRPHMGAWRPFEGYMRDRKGEWKLVCAGALGAYDAAQAAMAGYDTQEFLDLCEHCARLCAELPEDWDPRHTERLWLNISEDWKVLHRGSPFARYIV